MSAERAGMTLLLQILVMAAALQVRAAQQAQQLPAEDVITATAPLATTAPSESWHCTFQDDFCNMTTVSSYKGHWERNNTLDKVPSVQDTWYVAMSGNTSKGQRAGLETPVFSSSPVTPRCLTFFYYMDGANTGQISVLLRRGGDLVEGALWTQGRPQGQEWMPAHADIDFNTSVSIVFESKRGNNVEAVLALDEITIVEMSCNSFQPTDEPDQRTMCDFEDSLCGFTLENEKGEWLWITPHDKAINFPHPAHDHTYSTDFGHYLVAPLMDNREGLVGRVVTPEFTEELNKTQCLTFWYMHNGQTNKDALTVSIKHDLDIFARAVWRETSEFLVNFEWRKVV
ncbi:MAM and LDL-receptor class A domain-containing protein 1-like [Homarus americanus]|uniref:MAM and LDL-receptor class A domain-containing protein 1-like n=1 Tax=Homarus americanus TaxID=6706 RepID=UPI001C461019|nr:MAM and LDL-receptor class A domain-containing protein 1-like [Homarus americanus]